MIYKSEGEIGKDKIIKVKKQSIGLGDTVEKITNATGLNALTNMLQNKGIIKDCGCNERKKKLNKMFPYKK